MDKWAREVESITGRHYGSFAYEGAPDAEHVVVIMGSAAVTMGETVRYLTHKHGRKVGVLKVRLFRPWLMERFLAALPETCTRIAVLDRVKEVGTLGEPLFTDVCATVQQANLQGIKIIGGRYGLGGKDFTPGMCLSVFENLAADPAKMKVRFTVGISDDLTKLSLPPCTEVDILPEGTVQCLFYGLGSDGTVGSNKTAIKMIAKNTPLDAQGYFEYDAKKSGGLTVSHLRFGPKNIRAPYLVKNADYIGIHKESYIDNYNLLRSLKKNGVVAINATFSPADVEQRLPAPMLKVLADQEARLFLVDGVKAGSVLKLGKRINMVMQTVFFKLANVMPFEKAVELLKKDIVEMYGKKGDEVVARNQAAVDRAVDFLVEIPVNPAWKTLSQGGSGAAQPHRGFHSNASLGSGSVASPRLGAPHALLGARRSLSGAKLARRGMTTAADIKKRTADFVREQVEPVNALEGNELPVSIFQPGGRVPVGTSASEKRNIALKIPRVDMDKCTQCNYCSLICPHASIRPFLFSPEDMEKAPESLKGGTRPAQGGGVLDKFQYRVQVSPLDCTGCELCVRLCPADALHFVEPKEAIEAEKPNWDFAISVPNHGEEVDKTTVKGSQFQQPLLEFSGACEGCGETPYVKLLTQLLGDRLVIANATGTPSQPKPPPPPSPARASLESFDLVRPTGCSSIWGASNPSFPYTTNARGEGPAWANSLFEDNAEFGLGMRRAFKQRRDALMIHVDDALEDAEVPVSDKLRKLLTQFSVMRHEDKADMLLPKGKSFYNELKYKILPLLLEEAGNHWKLQRLADQKDIFGRNSHWIIGGDGWAYDIGFGGLDHVLASEEHVHILCLDTEMYSNTGGQASKSTPRGAFAKFAESGKLTAKKDLGQYAMTYKNVYVASICVHVNHSQAIKAINEAEAYPGPSLIIAYSPCISHGFPMAESIDHCKQAVESGYWPLYRYNPQLRKDGNNPFQLDSKKVTGDLFKFLAHENRFAAIMRRDPALAEGHQARLKQQVVDRAAALNVLSADQLPASLQAAGLSDSVTVLYGSETGNAEEQAKSIYADVKARGLKATLSALDDFEFSELPEQSTVLVVISTCGQGEFPANSHKFWRALQDTTLPASHLQKVKFAVFGLGDSTYSLFCVAAEGIDVRLAELGATRLLPRGIGDDRDEDRFYTGWDNWTPQLWATMGAPAKPLVREIPRPAYEVSEASGEAEPAVSYDSLVPPGATPLELTVSQRLTPDDYDRNITHYSFKIRGTGVSYNCGDVLAIYPRNDKTEVAEFCAMVGLDPTTELTVSANVEARNAVPQELSLSQLFETVLDVFGKPNRRFFDSLALFATDPTEAAELEALTTDEGKERYRDLVDNFAHHADVLRAFPSARPPLAQLMNMIPSIKPRAYSIASAPLMHPDEIELCVVAVDWEVPSTGEKRHGQCTSYLTRCKTTDMIMCSVKPSSIVLPKDDMDPILMAGMGTGLAPWRALTQHRVMQHKAGKKVGPVVIYYGARKEATEYIYKEELQSYEAIGVLKMHTAFSRDQARKIYVQHRIAEDYKQVYEYLVEHNGAFFVCGSSRNVPEDIYAAMKEVMMKGGSMGEDDAEAALSSLKMDGRYTVEAWS